MNAADVRGIFSKGNCSAQLSWGADVWRRRLSEIPFKVPLYDDLVGVLMTKMVVTSRSAIANPLLYENFTALSTIELGSA